MAGERAAQALLPELLAWSRRPAVVVLVGAAGSGKTTVRTALVAAGLDPGRVVSLDDEREAVQARDEARGLPRRSLQDCSAAAVHRVAERTAALLAGGRGYLADATHLRRRERVQHVRAATAAGLPAVAVLLPHLPAEHLAERVEHRCPERVVPRDVLDRHAHRRGLIDARSIAAEGFAAVVEVPVER